MPTCLVPRAPDPALTARAKRELGFVPAVLDYVAPCPWLARAEIAFYAARPVHLSTRLCELVPYVVAIDRECRHLAGALASFLRFAGYPDADLRAIETGAFGRFAQPEAVAFEHAAAVARARGRDTLAGLASGGHDRAASAELTALAALVVFGATVTTPLGLPPDGIEAFERSLLGRVLRPLIRRRIRATRKLPRLPATDRDHGTRFAPIVALLAGSPLHALSRDVLADAWRSPILPDGEKADLVVGVAEALGTTAIAVLPSARPSGRSAGLRAYGHASAVASAAELHASARALSGSLAPGELVEAVGIAALANAIGRMAILLDP